jgi:hypothetical protein
VKKARGFLAVFEHAGNVKGESFRGFAASLIEGSSGGNTAGKIGKADAEIGFGVLVEIGDVVHCFARVT